MASETDSGTHLSAKQEGLLSSDSMETHQGQSSATRVLHLSLAHILPEAKSSVSTSPCWGLEVPGGHGHSLALTHWAPWATSW